MTDLAKQQWDYVVVGAGAAGCVIASRLSERASNNVLLLEAGKDYEPGTEPSEILDIFAATAHSNPAFTWPGLSAAFGPRPGNDVDHRPRRRYTQGKVIGGSSSVNGMAANRGLPSDYDHWAEMGATGWNWDGVLPFFRKLETDRDFDGPMHGKDGPIKVQRYAKDVWPKFTRGVIDAVESMGWTDIADGNGVFKDGYFSVAYNHMDTRRVGPAWAYLTKDVRARPNLTVRGEHHVERLLFEGRRSIGVRVSHGGSTFDVHAREVIVSMGALHSPMLLLRSGVGPAHELKALDIDVVLDRRGVGKHLTDHPGVNFGCFMKPHARLPATLRRQMFAGVRWSSRAEGCPAGDMYFIPANKAQWHAIGGRIGLIMMWVNRSFSTGEVSLKSKDPRVAADIDFNMASDERDMVRLVQGVRAMVKIQAHPAVQQCVDQVFPVSYSDHARKLALYSPWNKLQTDIGAGLMDLSPVLRRWIIDMMIADAPSLKDLAENESICREWLKDAVHGHWHASGTCRMGRQDDSMAVTDPAGRVHGLTGLRVADASIMPSVPCANTNIPTIMIGEKIAAAIIAESLDASKLASPTAVQS
jgi:5-(hydroxymethyl)furfural/furfural oxidase